MCLGSWRKFSKTCYEMLGLVDLKRGRMSMLSWRNFCDVVVEFGHLQNWASGSSNV